MTAAILARAWASPWWMPVSFLLCIGGVGIAYAARPAAILAAGAATGIAAHRVGLTSTRTWRIFLRTTLFAASGALMFVTMWGFNPSTDIGLAAAVTSSAAAVLFYSRHRRKDDPGRAALYSWASQTNLGPWMTSLSTGISAPAVAAAATADVSSMVVIVAQLRALRRGASTTLSRWTAIDYLVPAAAAAGLCLGAVWERPFTADTTLTWLATVTGIAGIAGAAGSLLAADGHLPPGRAAVAEYLRMISVRGITLAAVGGACWAAGWLPTAYLPLLAAAAASAPTINPASLALLYGYRNADVVAAAMRAGLAIAAAGVWILAATTR